MVRNLNRRGSALLIVLGMMSFILVSAIAFSAYMRQSRLPSSYLRRTSSSRLLVKAAMARAIDYVDAAIGNNPHPGIGTQSYRYPRTDEEDVRPQQLSNAWKERVFIGGTNGNSAVEYVSPAATVSTLCLEALAYLPPPVINTVRYYSRRAHTAQWTDLGFDAGRYAFCAVDVSDMFDVNRLTAGYGRNSSDTGRISLAHVFENTQHNGYFADPVQWDDFMDANFVKMTDTGAFTFDNGKVPLISVADLNLAINKHQPAGLKSPFCEVVKGSYTDNSFGFGNTEVQEKAGKLNFIADSVMTATNRVDGETFDLENGNDQPFAGFSSDKKNQNEATIQQMISSSSGSDFLRHFADLLPIPTIVQLYDYLDRDSIPTSLALPTVERTPMITGVSLDGSSVSLVANTTSATYPGGTVGPPTVPQNFQVTTSTLHVQIPTFVATVGMVYPFKYARGNPPNFKVQAMATITLVPAGTETDLRRANAISPAVITKGDWTGAALPPTAVSYTGGGTAPPSVIVMRSALQAIPIPATVKTESDSVLTDIPIRFPSGNVLLGSAIPLSASRTVLSSKGYTVAPCSSRVIQELEWQANPTLPSGGSWVVNPATFPADPEEYGALPSNAGLSAAETVAALSGTTYVPSIQVTVRIVDADGKTVDLVPATFDDDDTPFTGASMFFGMAAQRPLLRFRDGNASPAPSALTSFSQSGFSGYGTKTLSDFYPKAYMVDDPRFNYAPENFIAMNSRGGTFKTEWFAKQQSKADGADGDIFMTTSDAGYLQSIYEFGHILRIVNFGTRDVVGCLGGSAYNGTPRVGTAFTPANHPAGNVMWRTYSAYDDDIAGRFREVVSGSRGFRVNPYTPSRDIMMAALANTPVDWWAASTNDVEDASGVKQNQLADLATANKYTFSEHSGAQVPLKYEELEGIADVIMGAVRGNPNQSWEAVFDDLAWDELETARLLGKDLTGVELHSIDKKFLHGFWRESFAVRQQLFLIFVRAEPMMMGSGAKGQTPPQLGARAVALVWRNPAPTRIGGNGQPNPHSTRILFYRQFD